MTIPTPHPSRTKRRMPRWLLILLIVVAAVLLVAAIAAVGLIATRVVQTMTAKPPAVGTRIVVPDESKAAKAAGATGAAGDTQSAAAYLAAQPTAYWLTPEIDPIGEVWDRVAHLAAEARDQKAALTVVIYGLPGRDCGNHSAGGLDEADYATWTEQIGQGLRNAQDIQKIVILEPDSLALAPNCGNITERSSQLSGAIDRINGINTWIYLDGGHSNWRSVDEMATLIEETGLLPRVRGFASNVSNYNDTAAEFTYAHALSDRLGGTFAVIDTGRNGAGAAGSEWCNPPGRLIGEPTGTYGDDVVDTNIWIKPPGESDGACNGGPAAGQWWPEAAIELTRDAR